MKKKHREITVCDVTFGWTIKFDCDGDGGKCLTIWHNKLPIHKQILNSEEITPAIIRKIIERNELWKDKD